MVSNIFVALKSKVRAEMDTIADVLTTGACKDYADYRYQVGRGTGLEMAQKIIQDVESELKSILDAEDDA